MRAKNCSKVPILTQMSIRLQSKVNNQLIVFKLKLLKADALSKLEVELQKLKDKVSSDQTFTIDENYS